MSLPVCKFCRRAIHGKVAWKFGRPRHPGCQPRPFDGRGCPFCRKKFGGRSKPVEHEGQRYHPGCLKLKTSRRRDEQTPSWECYPPNPNPDQEKLIQHYAQLVAAGKRIFE